MGDLLSERYGFGPSFAAEWRRQWGSELSDLLAGEEGSVDHLWGDFALSANLRGREMAIDVARRLTRGSLSLARRRALDLGCGVGGTAVALAELGAATVGVDPNADRIALAAANGRDRGVDVRLSGEDVLDPGVRADMGTFDVIVAEDVLEHVADALAGVTAIAELLSRGGLARVTIPNGDAIPLVIADAHYLLPGLTLLDDRTLAEAYFAAHFEWGQYEVGDYHSYDDYHSWFRDAGLSVIGEDLVEELPWGDIDGQFAVARQAVARAATDDSLPREVRAGLASGWASYSERVRRVRARGAEYARPRLGARFWRFYATKGGLRRGISVGMPPRWAWGAQVKRVPGVAGLARLVRR